MTRNETRTLLILLAAMLLAGVVMQLKFGVDGDKGWLLFATEKWTRGSRLYVDLFEINPPLIIWLYALPCELAAHFPAIRDYEALALMGFAFIFVVVALGMHLIAAHPAFDGDPVKIVLFGALLTTLFIPFTMPVFFFDREHIMLVLTFPYLLRFMPSLRDKPFSLPVRILIAVLAAAGFFIKLHAMIMFALFQLLRLWRQRPRAVLLSTENCVIYVLGVLYFAAICYFTPDYFSTVLPLAIATYSEFNIRTNPRFYRVLAGFALAAAFADFRPRWSSPWRPDIYYFTGVVAVYFVYTLINNGWGYTYHPLFSMLVFLTVWMLCEYTWLKRVHGESGLPVEQFVHGQRACLTSLGITACYTLLSLYDAMGAVSVSGHFDSRDNPGYIKYIEEHKVKSFGLLSGEFTRWPQISQQSGAAWVTRFNHLWMVPALVKAKGSNDTHLDFVRDYVGNAYAQDLTLNRPDIVLVDNSDQFFTAGYYVDLPALFLPVPAFAKAWHKYRYEMTFDYCKPKTKDATRYYVGCRYDVYRRADLP